VGLKSGRVLAGAAYFSGSHGPAVVTWNEAGVLEMLRLREKLDERPFAKGAIASHGSPGGALTVSSDGGKSNTGIIWATISKKSADHGNAQGSLYAFDAETLQELWSSDQNEKRDRLGTLVKFVPPVVEHGRVYVPNYDNAVNVYGLLLK
jgi:outer membrane protein assembly factor BamB